MKLQRHQLAFIDANANFTISSCQNDKSIIQAQVQTWFKRGLPCIYTRQLSEDKNFVNLGLPLIINNKKYRIGLRVNQSAILKYQPLTRLVDMQDFFLRAYAIDEIAASLELGLVNCKCIAVYGSFLFQYLSGQEYVTENSDLDLLIDYPGCTLRALKELLFNLHKKFNRTIDGEVRFDSLGDIAIQELLDLSAKQLLVKHHNKVELLSRRVLYESYPSLCANG